MRIATWNLERPSLRSWKKLPAQRQRMREVDADIWILTETRESICPSDGYHGVHAPPHPKRRPDTDERWVSIWTRWPQRTTSIQPSPRGSLAALCETPLGDIFVYGTVLPWANEPGDGKERAPMWSVHYEEIERQGKEWQALRAEHPDAKFVLAGDFNQDRDGSHWYGTHRGRAQLTDQLRISGLTCATAEDVVAAGMLESNHLIDHICLSEELASDVAVTCWERVNSDGVRMSDHPCVAVDIG